MYSSVSRRAFKFGILDPYIRFRLPYSTQKLDIDSLLVLSRDLFEESIEPTITRETEGRLISSFPSYKVSHNFNSDLVDDVKPELKSILANMKNNADYRAEILRRAAYVQSYVGESFPLLIEEKLTIMWGLLNFSLNFGTAKKDPTMVTKEAVPFDNDLLLKKDLVKIDADKLRLVGRNVYTLHLNLNSVFLNELHLSSSSAEIEYGIKLLQNEDVLIPSFMKQNLIFDCIVCSRSVNRGGVKYDKDVYEMKKQHLKNITSIGSFYTLLGILLFKFDKARVIDEIIKNKVINGPRGIMKIASDELSLKQ